ncbi:hypothetical protein BDR26DRAFT_894677 [Obelidium mucronatum]|nr:hypothetical protein BDR26DRAFT_894677 [Obelidium mucronatum]
MTSERALMPLDSIITLFEVVLLAVVTALVARDAAACAAAWHQAFTAHYHFGLAKDHAALVHKCQSLSQDNSDLCVESRATASDNRTLKAEISRANAARVETDAKLEEAKSECRVLKHQLTDSTNCELDLTDNLLKDLAHMSAWEKDTAAQLAVLIPEARGLDQEVTAASILGAAQTAKVESLVAQLTRDSGAVGNWCTRRRNCFARVEAAPICELAASVEKTVSPVSVATPDEDDFIAQLPPLPELPEPAFAFDTNVPASSSTVEFITTQVSGDLKVIMKFAIQLGASKDCYIFINHELIDFTFEGKKYQTKKGAFTVFSNTKLKKEYATKRNTISAGITEEIYFGPFRVAADGSEAASVSAYIVSSTESPTINQDLIRSELKAHNILNPNQIVILPLSPYIFRYQFYYGNRHILEKLRNQGKFERGFHFKIPAIRTTNFTLPVNIKLTRRNPLTEFLSRKLPDHPTQMSTTPEKNSRKQQTLGKTMHTYSKNRKLPQTGRY